MFIESLAGCMRERKKVSTNHQQLNNMGEQKDTKSVPKGEQRKPQNNFQTRSVQKCQSDFPYSVQVALFGELVLNNDRFGNQNRCQKIMEIIKKHICLMCKNMWIHCKIMFLEGLAGCVHERNRYQQITKNKSNTNQQIQQQYE